MRNFQNTCEEAHLAKFKLEIYNFTKNELHSRHFKDNFTVRIPRAPNVQGISQWLLLNKSSNRICIHLILNYDFPSNRTNNICKDFLIFRYFISYGLFSKAFLSMHRLCLNSPKRFWTFTVTAFIKRKYLSKPWNNVSENNNNWKRCKIG